MKDQDIPSTASRPADPDRFSHPAGSKATGLSESDHGNPDFTGITYQPNRNNESSQTQTQPPNTASLPRLNYAQDAILSASSPQPSARQGSGMSPTAMSLNGFSLGHDYDRSSLRGGSIGSVSSWSHNGPPLAYMPTSLPPQFNLQGLGENAYGTTSPTTPQHLKDLQNHATPSPGFRFGSLGESPLANFFGASPMAGSPGWLNLSTPSQPSHRQVTSITTLRYPVLRPLLPYIESIVPVSLACDLLELYFTSSSTVHLHPVSPYILGYLFRKQSFLDPRRPRACSPALLSSMLWLAAQTSDSPFLTSPPSARK